MPEIVELDDILKDQVEAENRTVTFLPEPPAEELFCPIISVDDHAFEPPDTFTSRVPAQLRDRVPYVTEHNGFPHWVVDGERWPFLLANGSVNRPAREVNQGPQRMDGYRAGVYDLDARVHDMDLCGIWASLCFPSMLWGFAGTRFLKMADREAALASLRAYNDWVIDEWCAAHPDRLIPCQLPWLADPEIAAEEIRRNSARGFRAVSFIENPEPLGLPSVYSPFWDPFFAACEETGTVVNLHVGSSGLVSKPSAESPAAVTTALFPIGGIIAAVDWVFARVPIRFPRLKITLSEAGVAWVPMVIDRLRRAARMNERTAWRPEDPSPLETFRRSFYFTSIEDPLAFTVLGLIGEDKVMVEADYPHGDTTWPGSQAMVRGEMTDLDPRLVRKVCYGNAADLYRWAPPPDELLRRSAVGVGARGE